MSGLFEAQMTFVDAGLAVLEKLKNNTSEILMSADLRKKAMEFRKTGRIATVVLPKPFTLGAPTTYTKVDGEEVSHFGDSLYCRTGTVLTFDLGYWIMPDSFVHEHLDEGIEVHYDIPGKKVHSIHTTGTFLASVHCISNLAYHANIE
jgi:hypothetical protein